MLRMTYIRNKWDSIGNKVGCFTSHFSPTFALGNQNHGVLFSGGFFVSCGILPIVEPPTYFSF